MSTMKTISTQDVLAIYQALVAEEMSREDASSWASEICDADDESNLEYIPVEDESLIWQAVEYIQGFDMAGYESDYLLSMDDLKGYFEAHFPQKALAPPHKDQPLSS